MKNAWKTVAALGMAVAMLSGAEACRRGAGVEGRFEYTTGWMSAELTRVMPPEKDTAETSEAGTAEDGEAGEKQPVRLEIPKKLGGRRVRSVAPRAFQQCTDAVSVKVPSRVSRIGEEAFAGCTELVWAELPSHLERLEDGLFSNCRRMVESVIPERVEEIGARAYSGCVRLRRVAVPEGVRSVGEQAFSGCASLGSLELPSGVTVLGPNAFRGCKSLETFVLPPRLTKLEEGLFEDCSGLGKVEIPAGVAELGPRAFKGCASLASVDLPEGLGSVGEGVFADCRSLEHVELPPGIAYIPAGAFEGCRGLRSVGIPAGVTNIGARAFAGCTMLEAIELPEGVQSVGEGAFEGCERLAQVEFPEAVTVIEDGCCRGCVLLEAVGIPAGVTNIGARAFAGCATLEGIELPAGVRTVGDGAFEGCALLERVALPETVGSLGARAFAECEELKSVELPAGLATMGRECFRGTGLENVSVPSGVAVLEEGVFADCNALAAIGLVPGLETVGADAFLNCRSLTAVLLPETVRMVQPGAFTGCSALGKVEVKEGNPACCSRDGVLFGDGGAELVCFPSARGGTYNVPEDVKRIAPNAFRASGVEGVRVPGSVESIGGSAFRDCLQLQWVGLADGVREVGDAAFMGCLSLWELVLPGSVGRAGQDLVARCDELLVLVVPDGFMPPEPWKEDWQVPPGCTICSRSGREEARQGRWMEDAPDPFYGCYTGEELGTVTFEGTILAASPVPDPSRNDYDDCLYALLVEVDSLLSTTSCSTNLERVVLVNVPIMKDRTIVQANGFGPEDKISCICTEYDAMPQAIQEIQLSDDIQTFEYRQYYPLRIDAIQAFSKTGNKNFAKREISILPVQSLPRDAHAAAARRERILNEIARIEGELEKHGGSFEAWKEEYRPIAEKYARLCEGRYAGWINDSYFAAGGGETTYDTQAYIEGLLPYKKHLERNNIDLIVARVPSRWDFAARVLASDDFQENPAWVEHCYECLKHDIEIIDPMPEMWRQRFDFPLFYFYHCPAEFHPCEGTAFVLAKEIAKVLERYPFQKDEREITLRDFLFETDRYTFFWPSGNDKFDPAQNLVFKQAVQDNEPLGVVLCSGSPFLFFSGSSFWFPQGSLGASVPGYTAYFIQTSPDWFYQRGDFNPLVKHLANSKILHSRRAVIMVGGPETWTNFPPIPRYILEGGRRVSLEKTIAASSDEITIDGMGSFSHSVAEDGSVRFEPIENVPREKANHFDLEFTIPCVEGKHSCMVRVNIGQASHFLVHLVEEGSDAILDTSSFLPGTRNTADFFVPLADGETRAKIRFQPKNGCELFVKDIELWYY